MLAHYVLEDTKLSVSSPEIVLSGQPIFRVLLISDDARAAHRFGIMLAGAYPDAERLEHVVSPKDGLRLIGSGRFDIAFIDLRHDDQTAADLIHAAGGRLCATPMVLMSPARRGSAAPDLETEAVEAGAADFLDPVELSPALLRRVIRYARFNHKTARQLTVEGHRHRMRAETASAASEEKTRFLAQMSHELRTPLNAIIGFADLVKSEMFGPIEGPGAERYRGYLNDIHSSGGHLLSLINDLLDLSKIEAGRMELSPEPVPLTSLMDDISRMTAPQAAEKRITLSLREKGAPDRTIFADPRLMTQALLNLVANAIKFTPDGGTVTLSTRRQGENIVIAVSDTGCGIDESDLKRVLEPFRQVAGMAAYAGPSGAAGTGLGLPLAKAIMEQHDGGLEIASEAGAGTTVSVWLPLHRA